jgi:hypothetical protein
MKFADAESLSCRNLFKAERVGDDMVFDAKHFRPREERPQRQRCGSLRRYCRFSRDGVLPGGMLKAHPGLLDDTAVSFVGP